MKQRLLFGRSGSLGRVALRGAVGGRFTFVAPKFGPHCVCCNADTLGRTQDYDPSTDRISAAPVPMPVCFDCKDHALQTSTVPMLQAMGVLVGLALTGLATSYATQRPGDSFLYGMMVAGAALVVVSIAWIRATSRRKRAARTGGHHPGLEMSVATGATLLDTENETLVEELLVINPDARRLPTPLLWRLRGEGMPRAKVVKRTD